MCNACVPRWVPHEAVLSYGHDISQDFRTKPRKTLSIPNQHRYQHQNRMSQHHTVTGQGRSYNKSMVEQIGIQGYVKDSARKLDWGRRKHANAFTGIKALLLMIFSPVLTVLLTLNIQQHYGDLWRILEVKVVSDFWNYIGGQNLLPMHQFIASFLVLQIFLHKLLPGPCHTGQHTPDGQLLVYKTNGLRAFAATYILFWLGHMTGICNASFIANNFGPLVLALNLWGLSLTAAVYIKACIYPTSLEDRVFTGSFFYDICMGVELNPRLPLIDDLKLFIVGRIGMMLWPLVLTSFAALQYENTGGITGAMLVGTILQFEYIIDFYWFEHWYLRTIDIAHDHVGFYMAWGCTAWLPSTYTIHAQFLAYSGMGVGDGAAIVCLLVGSAGYFLFRVANNQKYRVREARGKCMEWGRPATYITAHYITADGKERESVLLTCGWWGLARHINYVGDLIFSFATCAVTGFDHGPLPWFYAIYLWILLLHRCVRDEARCEKKYGKDWHRYCEQVRWRLVPYVL